MKLLLVAAAAAAALVLAGSALADQTFTDSSGEVAGSADVSTVAVSNNPTAGTITFTVTSNMPTFEDNAVFAILVDSDQNTSTGDTNGFDYLVAGTNAGAVVINATSQASTPESSASFANGAWTITFPAADIGSPTAAFNFVVGTLRGPDQNNPIEDDAPDSGEWAYTMVQAPAPPPTPAPKPVPAHVSSVAAKFTGVPTHGKAFHIGGLTVDLSNGVETKASAVKCTATLGGKHLAGTGVGGCTFHLPATAKGKAFVVKVTGKYKAVTVTKTQRFKVK